MVLQYTVKGTIIYSEEYYCLKLSILLSTVMGSILYSERHYHLQRTVKTTSSVCLRIQSVYSGFHYYPTICCSVEIR